MLTFHFLSYFIFLNLRKERLSLTKLYKFKKLLKLLLYSLQLTLKKKNCPRQNNCTRAVFTNFPTKQDMAQGQF